MKRKREKTYKEIPLDLWVLVGSFFKRNEYFNFYLNKGFLEVIKGLISAEYRYHGINLTNDNKIKISCEANTHKTYTPDVSDQICFLLNKFKKLSNYYTLYSQFYIKLFEYVKQSNPRKAIEFILSALNSNEKYTQFLIDFIFLQKDCFGFTVLTCSRRSDKMTHFLNFFFKNFILHPIKKFTESGILILKDYHSILLDLSQSKMSVEALCLYASAHLCREIKICRELSAQPGWDKTWISSDGYSLLLFATLFSNVSLAKYVMTDITAIQKTELLNAHHLFDSYELYCNPLSIDVSPIQLAAMSKNVEMIAFLEKFAPYQPKEYGALKGELMFYFIEKRNINGLRYCLDYRVPQDEISFMTEKYFNCHNDFAYDGHFTPLTLAVQKNWLEGALLLIESGENIDGCCSKLNKLSYQNTLSLAVRLKYFAMAKLLLKHGADPKGFADSIVQINKKTPLDYAAQNGDLPMVLLLIKYSSFFYPKNPRPLSKLSYIGSKSSFELA